MIRITGDTQIFHDITSAILVMQTEAYINVTNDGLKCSVPSLDRTAAVMLVAPKTVFDNYEVSGEVGFGIKVDDLKKRLVRCGKKVGLEIDQDVKIFSDGRRYGLALFKVEPFDKEIKVESQSSIKIPTDELIRILGDVNIIADKVTIETTGDKVKFTGKGDLASDNYEYPVELAEVSGTAKASYLLSYLLPMSSAVKVDTALIQFGSQSFLKMTMGNVIYMLGNVVKD